MIRNFVHITSDQQLEIKQEPLSEIGKDEVLIKVCGIGINRGDLLQRRGLYPAPADASPILGLEVSGEVMATGSSVTEWEKGDLVCALTHGAGYCDYTIVQASQCLPVPKNISLLEAAALPEALFTVWHNVFQRCSLTAGESFLVHGGASGIGTIAIQMALAFGAIVYTTAGTQEKCNACKNLGASIAINYTAEDFEQILLNHSPNGIDVILDMAGGDFIKKNIKIAAADGRICSIAFVRGSKLEINFTPILLKRLTLTASTLRAQTLAKKKIIRDELRVQVFPKIERGEIKPVIDKIFEFDQVEKAHQYMESGAHIGKILLRV